MHPSQNGATEPEIVQLDGGDESEDKSETLGDRYRGETPPGKSDEWEITSAYQRTRSSGVETATGDVLEPWTAHLYVTARRETGFYAADYDHWVFVDEDALREWLEQ